MFVRAGRQLARRAQSLRRPVASPLTRGPARRFAHAEAAEPAAESSVGRHPDYEGVESIVRFYLPHDYNIVYANLAIYTVVIGSALMYSSSKAAAAKANAPAPTKPDFHTQKVRSEIPSMEDDGWAEWVEEDEGNFELYIQNLDKADA